MLEFCDLLVLGCYEGVVLLDDILEPGVLVSQGAFLFLRGFSGEEM